MATTTYHGSCHCKRVTFEADLDLSTGTGKCNCTYCWKIRNWSVIGKPEQFRLLTGKDELTDYTNSDYAAELVAAPVRVSDGRANNWMNPPAESRHL